MKKPFEPKRTYQPGKLTFLYGIPAETIARWTGVHITTARRWKRGEEPPQSAATLIQILANGDLGFIDPAWAGWRLDNGELVAPDQSRYTPGNVMAEPFLRMLIAEYQHKQRYAQQADWIDERWVTNVSKEAIGEHQESRA